MFNNESKFFKLFDRVKSWMLGFASAYYVAIFLVIIYIFVFGIYIYKFGSIKSPTLSEKPEVWGQLGDFLGGILNPILSFATIVYLIKQNISSNDNAKMQKAQLQKLMDDSLIARKNDILNSFDTELHQLISAQKMNYESFSVDVGKCKYYKEQAVNHIEDCLEAYKEYNISNDEIKIKFASFDHEDKIFNILRVFCLVVKLIGMRLTDENGFSKEDRENKIEILIAFTDFAVLRIVLMAMKYTEYYYADHLRKNNEFNNVLERLKLSANY